MPYVKRTDGFEASALAHRGDRIGGINGLVRDRSVQPHLPTDCVMWVSDIRPGDTVIDEATYKSEATRLLDLSYTKHFVPVAEAEEAARWAELEQEDAMLDDAVAVLMPAASPSERAPLRTVLNTPGRAAQRRRLVAQHQQALAFRDANRAERDAIKADLLAGRHCLSRAGRWPVAQEGMA